MFVRQNQQQFRNSNADVQIFYASSTPNENEVTWNKPPGVSFVYMLLIGGGGSGQDGGGGTAGGGGAITRWFGSAQNVPDNLQISVGRGGGFSVIPESGSLTRIYYYNNVRQTLLTAGPGSYTGAGGVATTAGVFANMGFYQSVAGQSGATGLSGQYASSSTFTSGGSGGSFVEANYGYRISSGGAGVTADGFFMLQPMIVSCGSLGNGQAGIGSGGGFNYLGSSGGKGGNGLVLIASW